MLNATTERITKKCTQENESKCNTQYQLNTKGDSNGGNESPVSYDVLETNIKMAEVCPSCN